MCATTHFNHTRDCLTLSSNIQTSLAPHTIYSSYIYKSLNLLQNRESTSTYFLLLPIWLWIFISMTKCTWDIRHHHKCLHFINPIKVFAFVLICLFIMTLSKTRKCVLLCLDVSLYACMSFQGS